MHDTGRQSLPAGRELWRVGLLTLVVVLIWCAHHHKWTLASWSVPTEYRGDAPEILAQMKAAAEGDMFPLTAKVVERLGAPFGAHWNAFPTPDKPLLLLAGGLANVIGLFAAANVVMLLAPLMSAWSFYLVARWLRCRWEWAWTGALLFAYTYHTFHRGLGHFSIAFTWTVPLGLLAVWLVARSQRLEWRSAGVIVCLGSAVALGVSNPYNLLFWCQLMGWALLAQWFNRRRRQNLGIGLAAIGVAGLAFVLSHAEVWVFVQEPTGAPLIARNYSGTEIYALKPVEMFIPPTFHRWEALAFLGHRYVRWSTWRGEAYLPYLGLVGIAALIWLSVLTARRIFARQAWPGQALSVGWLVAYASVGGITNVLALIAGFQIFRATNRVAIFIAAILLVFLMVRMTRLTVRWPAWARVSLAFAVAALGVLDQVPRSLAAEERAEIAAIVRSDVKLGRDLEAALPAGAMVFQLPVLGFPEVTPPNVMSDYELFRPFLVTDTLRFSYGAAKNRSRSRWQRDLEGVPTATLVRRLEAYGFGALYVNRRGYADKADALLRALADLGYDRRIQTERGQQVAVLLHPQAPPKLPLGRSLTFGAGWHSRPSGDVRWAFEDASLSYYNPYTHPITLRLQWTVVGVNERELTIMHRGRQLAALRIGAKPETFTLPEVVLPPGVNVLHLRSNAPAVRVGTGAYLLRTFGLSHAKLEVVSDQFAGS